MLTNKCYFMGTIFKIEAMKMTSSNKKTCTATVSVKVGKTQDGKTIYDYVPIRAYEQKAELLDKYFPKGKAIAVETHYHGYKMQDDAWRYEFIVDDIAFVPSDYTEQEPQERSTQPQVSQYAQQTLNSVSPDDLPF